MKRLLRLLALVVVTGAAWVAWQAFAPPPAPPPHAAAVDRIDRILIEKSARRLTASRGGETVLEFPIALGFAPSGDKEQEGDGKTPEGLFRINRRNPNSAYHLSLGIDYPKPDDRARAEAAGLSPGGDIFIHGQPNSVGNLITLPGDWTAGCIAVNNEQMQTLWRLAEIGTVVEIRP
ncbi:murein L,D-transpeptidase family protein [Leisingera daeponensis]|uniref:L,D-transpeptidase family protein n=1 Tax=Leisingera daeponensis TaxID=405746 RepID=UPI001C9467CD|nr:L,D-transpeptidase family protein [Leisingera daeponensis]MBY6057678.1 L,D-transpeptidase family protein [Leisingera daeponensis]